jgi:endonuclease/exonuclease/phosphatase (EEP) superfamily protein YafD
VTQFRWVGRALYGLGWAIVVGLAVLALARVVVPDRSRLLTLANANALWAFLPAYVVAAAALARRRWALGVVAVAVVAAHVAWVLPQFTHQRAVPDAARRAPRVRIVTANLRYDNERPEELAAELDGLDADVLVLQEVTPRWWRVLRDRGLVGRYEGVHRVVRDDAGGAAVLARTEFVGAQTIEVEGWPVVQVDLELGGRVRVVAVHPVPPLHYFERHRRMTRETTALVREALRDGLPTIVAGDFNATQYNEWLGQVGDLGLASAHESRGRPLATTWPNGMRPVPPLRLDHVLLTDELLPVAVREGDGAGSDHRPVVVDIALLPPPNLRR